MKEKLKKSDGLKLGKGSGWREDKERLERNFENFQEHASEMVKMTLFIQIIGLKLKKNEALENSRPGWIQCEVATSFGVQNST